MNRILYYITIVFITGAFASCEKMDETYKEFIIPNGIVYPGKATSAVVCPGKYRAKVAWLRGADPKVTKAKVFWNNYTDSVGVDIPEGLDSIGCLVEPLEENTYTFIIKTYDNDGNVSIPVEVSGKVYGDIYQSGLYNRSISSENRSTNNLWTIMWGTADETDGIIATYLEYEKSDGNTGFLRIPVFSNVTKITDAAGSDYKYRTLFLPDSLAIDSFYTDFEVRPLPDISYWQFNLSHIKQLSITQGSSDYEYSLKTTGIDPYVWLTALTDTNDPAQVILTFEYQCSIEMSNFQIYFGASLSDARSIFTTLNATNSWKTFSLDISDQIAAFNWGNAGDFLRLDFGNQSGVTLKIRNIYLKTKD